MSSCRIARVARMDGHYIRDRGSLAVSTGTRQPHSRSHAAAVGLPSEGTPPPRLTIIRCTGWARDDRSSANATVRVPALDEGVKILPVGGRGHQLSVDAHGDTGILVNTPTVESDLQRLAMRVIADHFDIRRRDWDAFHPPLPFERPRASTDGGNDDVRHANRLPEVRCGHSYTNRVAPAGYRRLRRTRRIATNESIRRQRAVFRGETKGQTVEASAV